MCAKMTSFWVTNVWFLHCVCRFFCDTELPGMCRTVGQWNPLSLRICKSGQRNYNYGKFPDTDVYFKTTAIGLTLKSWPGIYKIVKCPLISPPKTGIVCTAGKCFGEGWHTFIIVLIILSSAFCLIMCSTPHDQSVLISHFF